MTVEVTTLKHGDISQRSRDVITYLDAFCLPFKATGRYPPLIRLRKDDADAIAKSARKALNDKSIQAAELEYRGIPILAVVVPKRRRAKRPESVQASI